MFPRSPIAVEPILTNEPSTQRLVLERGDLDVAQITSVDDIPALQRNPDIVVQADPTILRQYYLFLNTKKGPTADKNVRQAIAWAYDYEAHNQLALKGFAKAAVGPFPPEMVGRTIPNIVPYGRDPQKAREALARSVRRCRCLGHRAATRANRACVRRDGVMTKGTRSDTLAT